MKRMLEEKQKLDADLKVLFIEFLRDGRFDDYFAEACRLNQPFPDEVLWSIFGCCKLADWFRRDRWGFAKRISVFRAVVGVAYGGYPRDKRFPNQPDTSQPSDDGLYREVADGLPFWVGDFDNGHHQMAPMIKIADLGASTRFDKSTDPLSSWEWRRRGKPPHCPPEQFANQWGLL
ncbi:hypothetical protein B0T14DRAFT_571828 [Immersiella caudata]|uniref:Uncharacterized protein n=1 Tax=Immersiella caudata TaxID=314043 RepID=A0AA39T1Z7_9PEZI|nr:hypothetical protein B0T14DRAFT_571828 [Immersiella caudata]